MYFQVEMPHEATAALTIVHSDSSVAGVQKTHTGQVDAQWIVVIVVNYHFFLCAKLLHRTVQA